MKKFYGCMSVLLAAMLFYGSAFACGLHKDGGAGSPAPETEEVSE